MIKNLFLGICCMLLLVPRIYAANTPLSQEPSATNLQGTDLFAVQQVVTLNGVTDFQSHKLQWQSLVTAILGELSATAPLIYSNGVFGIQYADSTHDGVIRSSDYSAWNLKQNPLGFIPENVANKGTLNGYASLDSTGKVPSSQLPAVSGAAPAASYYITAAADSTLTGAIDLGLLSPGGLLWWTVSNGVASPAVATLNQLIGAIGASSSPGTNRVVMTGTSGNLNSWITAFPWSGLTGIPTNILYATINSPTVGQILQYDGNIWKNATSSGGTQYTASAPLSINGNNVISITTANSTTDGMLTQGYFNAFNGKLDPSGNGSGLTNMTKGQVGLGNVQNVDQTNPSNITQDSTHRFATDAQIVTWTGKQNALGYTAENTTNKGASNGYAPLDSGSKVPIANLPTGTSPGNIVQLDPSSGKLPALDGSLLTGISGSSYNFTSPLANNTGTISIASAKADGTTRGAASFSTNDFSDNGSGLISLNYANAQKASSSNPGILTSTDWVWFNAKQPALGYTAENQTNKVTSIGSPGTDTNYPTEKATSTALSGKQAIGNYLTALTGDISATGPGSVSATIQPGAVTLAKMANLAANAIMGNNTASPAAPIALTPTQVKVLLSLANVENIALSTWAGSAAITTLGTIVSGTIPWANLSGIPANLNTFSGIAPSANAQTLLGHTFSQMLGDIAALPSSYLSTDTTMGGATPSDVLIASQKGSKIYIDTGLATKQATGNYLTALTGDVAASGPGSATSTIQPGAVTLSKMANLTANSILGNNTGSAATPVALTTSQLKSLIALNNVENTALSTWIGSGNITTVGALVSGSIPYTLLTGTIPTWNQNTTGTANNITGTLATTHGGTGWTDTTFSGSTHEIATISGTLTNTHAAGFDNSGNIVDIGSPFGGYSFTAPLVNTSGTISASSATSSTQGIASFNTGDFTVTTGAVALGANAIKSGATVTPTNALPVAYGGTGTATPGLVAGTNITVTGSWPNQTIAASGGGSGTIGGTVGTTANAIPTANGTGGSTLQASSVTIDSSGNVNLPTGAAIEINANKVLQAASGSDLFDVNNGTSNLFIVDVNGKAKTTASSTTSAGLNVPHGVAPTTPANGDIWTTTSGLYAYINGSTVGPFGSGGSGANANGYYIVNQSTNAPTNAINLGSLTTGILKLSVSGGVATPSIAVAGDFPTLNQSTTGNSANVTGIVVPANGGTGVANGTNNTTTFTGNYTLGWTLTGNTSVTLPTSGTIMTTTGNTSGSAGSLSGAYIDWNASSGGASILNKPTLGQAASNLWQIPTSPGADSIWMWDNTDASVKPVAIGANLTYTHSTHTLSASASSGMTNPMTNIGDLIVGGTGGAPARLAGVAAGQPFLSGGVNTTPGYAGYTFSGTAAQTYTFPSTSKTMMATDFSNAASGALPNGTTATTQTAGSNDTKLATDQYVDTGLALKANLASPTLTGTPNIAAATGTSLSVSGTLDGLANMTITTGAASQTITVSNSSGYYVNNTSGAITYQLPATATGKQYVFRNAAGVTGAITIKCNTSEYIDKDGALGTVTTGTLVSGGALGDRAAVYGQDATHWLAELPKGTWTNN